MAFIKAKRMIHNLLNTDLLASCVQEVKGHKSIED